ncbi:uncharacterized protein [Eurosta solidaginis]|uniref:uncharacterized protein n=1 Tax=Eurosta solidaginis TaxID=178769 RepID=UPI0035306E2A
MSNANKDIATFRDATSIMQQFNEKLIEKVRIHKVLYNKQGFGNSGLQEKQIAWQQIAYSLGSTAADCSRRFKSLRERYSRELKHLESEGKSEDAVEWPYFKAMSFLRKYVKQRNPRTTFSGNDFKFLTKQLEGDKEISAEDSYFSDTCNQFYEVSTINGMALKEEINSPSEDLNSRTAEITSPIDDVLIPRQMVKEGESSKAYPSLATTGVPRQSTAIQSFGQTVTAFLSEMSEAKQAKAMRVLFDALITIKMEPEET